MIHQILKRASDAKNKLLGFVGTSKPNKPKTSIDFESDYQIVINLLEEINQKDLKELEMAEWPSHKKMVKEARSKIEEAVDLLKMASKAPSNIVW